MISEKGKEVKRKCKKHVRAIFKNIIGMAEEIKKAKLPTEEEVEIARSLEKYQNKLYLKENEAKRI